MDNLSKKEERKERLRKEREMTIQDVENKERKKKMMLWVGSAFILGGVVALLVWLTFQEGWVSGEVVPVDVATDHWQGNPEASVTLVEYGDFQCPACRTAYEALKPVKEEYGDRVLFAYRHYAFLGDNSDIAAQATEAAALQNKDAFWQMHDMLFENQSGENSWKSGDAEQIIIGYAEELGLDVEQFKNDLNSSEVKNSVRDDNRSSESGKVTGTPSFFLNDEKVDVQFSSSDAFRELLDNALAESATQEQESDTTDAEQGEQEDEQTREEQGDPEAGTDEEQAETPDADESTDESTPQE